MRFSRSIVIPAILLALIAPATLAQSNNPGGNRQGQRQPGVQLLEQFQQALRELNLSEEQTTQASQIIGQARREIEELVRAMRDGNARERVPELMAKLQDLRSDLSAILDADQRMLFDEKLAEMRQNMSGQAGGNNPARGSFRQAQPGQPGQPVRPMERLQRIRQALPQLELTVDQQDSTRRLMEEMGPKFRELREQMQADPAAAVEKARELSAQLEKSLNEILTPDQQQKLKTLLEQPAQNPGRPGNEGRRQGQAPPATQPADGGMRGGNEQPGNQSPRNDVPPPPMMGDEPKDKPASPPASPDPGPRSSAESLPGLKVGDPIPDTRFDRLDGNPVQLSSFKGRIVVVLIGSYSSPAFRDRIAAFEQIRQRTGTRAIFYVVYTKEAHAIGEWEVERNRFDGVKVEQPKTLDERKRLASIAREQLKIQTPILLDDMNNTLATQFQASHHATAVIIFRDASVYAVQRNFEPHGFRRMLDEAISAAPATQPGR